MKWLSCLLLIVLATFTGVEGQDNCTYAECLELLDSLNALTPHTTEYCTRHNQTVHCVNEDLQQCGNINSDTAFAISSELFSNGLTCEVRAMTTTETPTPTASSIDCSYTLCTDLFHALNSNDSAYCERRAEVYDCLNTTLNSCPNGGHILNHDSVKMELDNLPSLSCMCVRCDDLYNELAAAVSPRASNYCKLHEEVDDCTQKIFDLCESNEALFWHAFTISNLLTLLPNCSDTSQPSSCKENSCLNGVYDCYPQMELNDGLPSFVDKSTNCAVKPEDNFYYYCGIYSYSHLRAFNSDSLYTCSSPGLWALFNHSALKVTTQNSVPNMNGPYTVVDELSVVISASNCSQETIYQASAEGDYLTPTFEDGTNGVNGLELILNSNGTSAYIRISWINTVILIHKLAGHIGIAIQSPASVANKSVGLCSLGCPEHSKLKVQEVLDRDSTGNCTQEAYISCSLNNGTLFNGKTEGELYYEKCIFDTLNTNNTNSSWISLAMVNSWHLLGTRYFDTSHGATSPEYENQQSTNDDTLTLNSSSPRGSSLCITMVTWCLMLYAITIGLIKTF